MTELFRCVFRRRWAAVFLLLGTVFAVPAYGAPAGGSLSATLSNLTAGAVVNLSREGELDWVHWGLYTETSVDRKAGVVPQISDFTVLDSAAGFAFVYQYGDNVTGYSWSDGTPTAAVTNTTTGVWAYGTPPLGSGFQITAPADSSARTLKVFVGAFACRGRFEAYLSDGSARGYTNTSLFNMSNGPGGFFTINYAAASAGQRLIIRWTLMTLNRPDGNVTLQAASLTSATANNPPLVALTAPADNASFAAGADLTLSATASDLDGTITKVEFYDGDTKLDEDTASPYSISWNNVPAGLHTLTAVAIDSGGAVSSSRPVEIFVSGSGGTLTGTLTVPPNLPVAVNLTAEGTADWTHWGYSTNSPFNRKAGVAEQISDLIPIGTNAVERYDDNHTAFGWSDGAPTLSVAGTTTGVFISGTTNGFELAVLADTTPRTVKIYLGLYAAQGNLQAWLSDFSAGAYRDTSLSNYFDNAYGVYALTFAAASPGQYLVVRYRALNLFDQDFGNVTVQAATLSGASVGNAPPAVHVTNPTNDTVLTAPASFTFSANASDSDGTVAQVEFFNGTASLGMDSTSPYGVPVSSLAAGTYTLSAVATDSGGAKATNGVTLIVNAPPTASLISPAGGASFLAPANLSLTATADDSDGTVAKVEFFEGANKLGDDTTSPYSLVWSNVAAGSYTLTVRATDNRGAVTTSDAVPITVGNSPPSPVTLLQPGWLGNGFVFSFATQSGRSYEVQRTDGLGAGTWETLGIIIGSGSTMSVTNANAAGAQHFYRVESK